MSEYQYYEFIAIDEPLTPKQMAELRACSSRANITPTSFVNVYQWGDLKANPVDWMRRYFDAHVYVANWCTCVLCLRLPKSVFDAGIFRAFKTETTFSVKQTRTHWLLEWVLDESANYERFAQEDGRGWMGRLAPLRDELLRGDMRPLYLGWLAGVSAGEVSEKSAEPQPPPGLSRLSAAQQSLVEFLEIDEDLLSAAGLVDPPGSKHDSEGDAELDIWIAALPTAEKNAMLKWLLTGHAQQAERKLKRQFLAWRRDQPSGAKPATPRRKVADLHKLAASAAEARKKQAAIQRKKAEIERQAKRETYLRTLADDFNRCWRNADKRAERGIASTYDEVKRSLVDLSDAYALCATRADFDRRLAKFMSRHGKRGALVRRLVEAGLWQKSQ
ncbi:cell envelope integrity protein TolA [Sedimenticola hydrogenitrophicus]|uniref:cell envelope integrity protein TolA n=1 Tax=Sedimenticola hydrogenitrophicus TaxID=2967975 RepID=UPI0021A87D5B|nr:cell envelope integrity protein TolA [Sedimenticola hydrogenitrophicus]